MHFVCLRHVNNKLIYAKLKKSLFPVKLKLFCLKEFSSSKITSHIASESFGNWRNCFLSPSSRSTFLCKLEKRPPSNVYNRRLNTSCKTRWKLPPLFSSRALCYLPALFIVDFTLLFNKVDFALLRRLSSKLKRPK